MYATYRGVGRATIAAKQLIDDKTENKTEDKYNNHNTYNNVHTHLFDFSFSLLLHIGMVAHYRL
jgi:hypothetical protein